MIKGVLLETMKRDCPHINGEISSDENLLIYDLDDNDQEILLENAYRHFGEIYFRPDCAHCRQCISIRIPVQQYSPSKSVRRLLNRNKNFRVSLDNPKPSMEFFRLYNQHKKRFETQYEEDYVHYMKSFYHPFKFNRMLCVWDDEKIVSVSHLDITAKAMSAVYCYFDQHYNRYSPGKFAVYKEIEIAKKMDIPWLYLGYYIPPNKHTHYKIDFKPNQYLTADNKWIDYMDNSGKIINKLEINNRIPKKEIT